MRRPTPHPSFAEPASRRLASLMTRTAGIGPWPGREAPGAPASLRAVAPPLAHTPIGARISGRLGTLAVRLMATGSATFARLGLGSIEARVLLALAAGPHTSSQMGNLIGIDRAAVSRAVQKLEERRLVFKLDGRSRWVRLTREGAELIESINQVSDERERRLLAGFSDEETGRLLDYLGRLMLNVPQLVELAESGVFAVPGEGGRAEDER